MVVSGQWAVYMVSEGFVGEHSRKWGGNFTVFYDLASSLGIHSITATSSVYWLERQKAPSSSEENKEAIILLERVLSSIVIRACGMGDIVDATYQQFNWPPAPLLFSFSLSMLLNWFFVFYVACLPALKCQPVLFRVLILEPRTVPGTQYSVSAYWMNELMSTNPNSRSPN